MTADGSPAVVLLSGGLDSTTTAAIAKEAGHKVFALTVDYGQRHRFELAAAAKIATRLSVAEHRTIALDLAAFGGSALTADLEVPRGRAAKEMAEAIPITYVPARNTVFLSIALAYAEVCQAAKIYLGVNAVDYSGYPDCRPEYLAAFEQLANLATKAGVTGERRFEIVAPLVRMTKAEIIRAGLDLGVDYGLTHSCYDPDESGRPCGQCDACLLRRQGFAEAGEVDPLPYPTAG